MFQESFLVLKYPAARKKEKRLIIIHFEVLTKKIFNGIALHFILYPASSSLIFEIENQGLWNGFNIKNITEVQNVKQNTEISLILANNLLYIYQNDKVFYYRGLKGIRILWIFLHWRLPWLINILFAWVYIFFVCLLFSYFAAKMTLLCDSETTCTRDRKNLHKNSVDRISYLKFCRLTQLKYPPQLYIDFWVYLCYCKRY